MSSEFGNKLTVNIFGESHGNAIGVVIGGLPAGEEIDPARLSAFLERRRGGKGKTATARAEADVPEFLSGLTNGKTNGFPLCAVIRNADTRAGDYEKILKTPRPGHADYTAYLKWDGMADMRGGGHFSGRLTAPLCVAGGIAEQVLARRGIFVGAHAAEIAGIQDTPFPLYPSQSLFEAVSRKKIPVIDDSAGEGMLREIENARDHGDSVGGIVEVALINLPSGLGSPMFDGIENRLARAFFGIPAVKGVEFGSGFEAARLKGSQNNDALFMDENGRVSFETNRAGGILGGISTGMPVVSRLAFKPTPSISRPQCTVDIESMKNTSLEITGRHDPCVVIRAVPVAEACAALCALDLILEGK